MDNNLLMGGTGFEMGQPLTQPTVFHDRMKTVIDSIVYQCKDYMSGVELVTLNQALNEVLSKYEILSGDKVKEFQNFTESNNDLMDKYMRAITLEGKSPRTLNYYHDTFDKFLQYINKPIPDITTQDIRDYLSFRKETGEVTNVSLDNIRRVLSTVFTWFHDERLIIRNPTASIKKIRGAKKVKKPLTPREVEKIRYNLRPDSLIEVRDIALFELLLSSGIRIAECVQLNVQDLYMDDCSFIVMGKGGKERECYFNAKAAIAIEHYLELRKDDNPALFVSHKKPYNRIGINGVERRMRQIGAEQGISLHPHLLRKTFATNLLRKDVPIEQVQKLLGHTNLDTTTIYAIADDEKVQHTHKRLLD